MGIITAAGVKMCLCKYKSATQPLYRLNTGWMWTGSHSVSQWCKWCITSLQHRPGCTLLSRLLKLLYHLLRVCFIRLCRNVKTAHQYFRLSFWRDARLRMHYLWSSGCYTVSSSPSDRSTRRFNINSSFLELFSFLMLLDLNLKSAPLRRSMCFVFSLLDSFDLY